MIREHDAFATVEEMVRRWDADWRKLSDAHFDFERRREEHARAAQQEPRLRDKPAGPPGEGWCFRWIDLPPQAVDRDDTQQDDERRGTEIIGAWIPPELLPDKRPDPRYPLPLPDGELTPPEKYAALAAIYNAGTRGARRIEPWKDSADPYPPMRFTDLENRAKNLRANDLPFLGAILDEIRRDLSSRSPRESKSWLKLAEAERLTGINRGTISRAADNGEIEDNKESGRARRVRTGSFTKWALRRAEKGEAEESTDAIERKMRDAGL